MLTPLRRRALAGSASVALVVAGAALAAGPGFATGADVTPPVITAIHVDTPSVNVTSAPATVSVSFSATDETGVDSIGFTLSSPGYKQYVLSTTSTLSSGTATNGIWQVSATVPKGFAAGAWSVGSIEVSDTANPTN